MGITWRSTGIIPDLCETPAFLLMGPNDTASSTRRNSVNLAGLEARKAFVVGRNAASKKETESADFREISGTILVPRPAGAYTRSSAPKEAQKRLSLTASIYGG